MERIETRISRECRAMILFDGTVTPEAIDKLIRHLELSKDAFLADEDEVQPTPMMASEAEGCLDAFGWKKGGHPDHENNVEIRSTSGVKGIGFYNGQWKSVKWDNSTEPLGYPANVLYWREIPDA